EAIEAFTLALRQAPKQEQAPLWRKLGLKHVEMNQFQEAMAAYAKSVELDPEHAEGHAMMGYVRACLGQSPLAATAKATEAVLLAPGDFIQLHNVACVFGKLAERAYKADDKELAREYEDVALILLRRGVELWERDRSGPNARAMIRGEGAFPRQ